jgi:SAM-dependent methyltransferase
MAQSCPACDSSGFEVFFEMPRVPVSCNVFVESREAALAAIRGDIHLAYCRQCGMIHNVSFDESLLAYTADYETSLHFSPHFQAFAEQTANHLRDTYALQDKDIVEIGCGKGDFLASFAADGQNRCTGFDASYDDNQQHVVGTELTIHKAFYTAASFPDVAADLLMCRQVLEHIETPVAFLRGILPILRRGGSMYCEVPDAMFTLRELGIWDLIYEHCSYFTAPTLERLMSRVGCRPQEVYSTFGGQFLAFEGHAGTDPALAEPLADVTLTEVGERVDMFAGEFKRKVAHWNQVLTERLDRRQCIAVWGAGSKGVTFLNTLDRGGEVQVVVDINVRKQGRHVAGTGQRIEAPTALAEHGVDTVLVMNTNYLDEIRGQSRDLGLAPEFMGV